VADVSGKGVSAHGLQRSENQIGQLPPVIECITVLVLAPQGATAIQLRVAFVRETVTTVELDRAIRRKGQTASNGQAPAPTVDWPLE
jgi:hypothetical protein